MAIVYFYVRDFFLFIGGTLKGLADVIWKLLTVLINMVTFLGSLIAHIPLSLSIPFGALIVVAVLYKILGREKGA